MDEEHRRVGELGLVFPRVDAVHRADVTQALSLVVMHGS